MATLPNVTLVAAIALVFWSAIGLAIGRRLLPGVLIWPFAPVIGWAAHSALSLPFFEIVGLTQATAIANFAIAFALAAYDVATHRHQPAVNGVRWWIYLGAGSLACAVAAAILPGYVPGGVTLAAPIFDHSKIAIVNEIVLHGVPPVNPFFGDPQAGKSLPYYYLFHFSAAEIAALTGVTGWDADAGMTWFAALASFLPMTGLAVYFGGRSAAAAWVVVLCIAGSSRQTLAYLFGSPPALDPLMSSTFGLSTWMFQVTWAPQHVISSSCIVVAVMVLLLIPHRRGILMPVLLGLLLAAAFESSTWVGGVLAGLALPATSLVVLLQAPPERRLTILLKLAGAAVFALALASPLIRDQWLAALARGGPPPVAIEPFEVLGEMFSEDVQDFLNVPAFWVRLLPVESPAVYFVGLAAIPAAFGAWTLSPERRRELLPMIVLLFTALASSSLLASKVAFNNDLGWRVVLPGYMMLTVLTAISIARWVDRRAWTPLAVAAILFAFGLRGGIELIRANTLRPESEVTRFDESAVLWKQVRQFAGPLDHVANNPDYLEEATDWTVNISWALLSERRSCFAGHELALAFVPISEKRRDELGEQFDRVFDGRGTPDDFRTMAQKLRCRVVVVTAEDGEWEKSSFDTSGYYRLAQTEPGKWRIYVAAGDGKTGN